MCGIGNNSAFIVKPDKLIINYSFTDVQTIKLLIYVHGQYLFYRVAHHSLISEKVTKNTNRSMTALFFFAQHLLFERICGGSV